MAWDGVERRAKDRRGCDWPACGAKLEADEKHRELRSDLREIKDNQKENGNEFRKLSITMEKVASLRHDLIRLEQAYARDIVELKTMVGRKTSRRELAAYGAIVVVCIGVVQFVIIYFAK